MAHILRYGSYSNQYINGSEMKVTNKGYTRVQKYFKQKAVIKLF